MPRTISAKNDAPRRRRNSSTAARRWLSTRFEALLVFAQPWLHPVGFFAHEESDGRDAGGNHAAAAFACILQRRRMRRQASPADRAGQAELVEPAGSYSIDAARENLLLPGIGRDLEALQLMQHLQQAALAAELRLRREVLPAQQPAHELRRGDGLDLLAQRPTVR